MPPRAPARLRCRACGYESANAAIFRGASRPRRWASRRYCAACAEEDSSGGAVAIGLTAMFGALAAASRLLPNGLNGLAMLWIFLAGLVLSAYLTTLVHEAGHVVGARLAGLQVVTVTMGSGRLLWRRRIGLWDLEVRLAPGSGRTIAYQLRATSRLRLACYQLAGSAANAVATALLLLLFAAVSLLWRTDGTTGWLAVPLVLILAAAASQLFSAVKNLIPRRAVGADDVPSDGKGLLDLLRRRPEPPDEHSVFVAQGLLLARAGRSAEARAHHEAGWRRFPEDGYIFGALIHWIGRLDGPDAALEVYGRHAAELPSPETAEDPGWAYAFGNIAWHVVLAEDHDQLDLADRMSAAAMRLGPTPPVEAVRGAVLAWLGDPATGVPMITNALPRIDEAEDKAEFCGVLARIEAARGELAMAEDYIRLERRLRTAIA